ncbi:MAG: hypothetical protein U5J63_02590 [Fodinibius sp.]|nr:hypothetical protein [Fodinibius sp.]
MAKYNERIEDLLDHHLIANEELTKRKENGGVGYLINGNMCLGVYGDMMVARVGNSLASTLVAKQGIHHYLPDKGLYDDLVMVEEQLCSHSELMQKFISKSIAYTRQLPPKQHKPDQLDS